MLKIAKQPQWTHTVQVSVPVDGGFEEQDCKVRFRLLDEALLDDSANNPETLLRAVVVEMFDLLDADTGTPLSWNDALRDRLFALPFVQAALIRGYYRSVTGAREGNSAGPVVRGPRAA